MKILLLGYGKMGKNIEAIALDRGHEVVGKINEENIDDLNNFNGDNVDVAIEFSRPEAAFENCLYCADNNIPVVSGTTGWLDRKEEIETKVQNNNGAFFYASNYSVGVNIFFKVNSFLARLMNKHPEYNVKLDEIHHTEKLDAPSGTAITLAEGVLDEVDRKESWVNSDTEKVEELEIESFREPGVPGTHSVYYSSSIDEIEIKHTAHSRQGFALGAVLVAEWILDKKGVLSMDNFMDF
ncbi:4-hydroxy-tetrahydrodipicolinate reductase [Aureibacter tunicatorum]|uniref:4-hydroxy-tetrahydrodipicolinate reductase n=1 Tax=Aureibacter tunicatorum TaxID=866807 RepID=A0AAE3XL33_9BACT|nr:4-hydroxy-tetrahydrodipicolinate reductase [Aureibacter tunicatorum]MDR6239841.1 4-hydroxy-tetrahydrodipicolinate reductase [Aureibacter tunicatorum]BDD04316.1 4-hydroxy-tetrahydrodipicolinate reductase [Aureibacter tunicatorum]